jgi:hypothetical protein
MVGFAFGSTHPTIREVSCGVIEPASRIIAIKARHPFIMRKSDRWEIAFELPSESGLARAKVAMIQVSGSHEAAS